MKIKEGLYLFSVTLENGQTHQTYKQAKTAKGANAYLTRFAKKVCAVYESEWKRKEWGWLDDFQSGVRPDDGSGATFKISKGDL